MIIIQIILANPTKKFVLTNCINTVAFDKGMSSRINVNSCKEYTKKPKILKQKAAAASTYLHWLWLLCRLTEFKMVIETGKIHPTKKLFPFPETIFIFCIVNALNVWLLELIFNRSLGGC